MTIDPQKITALAVHLYGRRIGILNRLGGDRYLFSFEQAAPAMPPNAARAGR